MPDLALLSCNLVSLLFLCDILSTGPVMPIMGLVNPFTDIYVDNPTRASMKNKALKV